MLLGVAFFSGLAFLVTGILWFKNRSTASALTGTARFTVRELGGIPIDGNVEVFGQTRVNQAPVSGPVSQTQGVWWRVKVTEHWRERRDDDSFEEMSRVISDTQSPEPFFIQDPTGYVAVMPNGIEFIELDHSFYSRDDKGVVVRLGLSLGMSASNGHWVETEEWVMPYDVNVLALAHTGQDQNGTRFLHRGGGNYQPFIARTDDPDQFEQKTAGSAKRWGWAAVGTLLVAVICAALNFLG